MIGETGRPSKIRRKRNIPAGRKSLFSGRRKGGEQKFQYSPGIPISGRASPATLPTKQKSPLMKKRNSLIYTLAKPAEKFYNKVNPSYSACPRAGINLGGNSMLYKKNIEKEQMCIRDRDIPRKTRSVQSAGRMDFSHG